MGRNASNTIDPDTTDRDTVPDAMNAMKTTMKTTTTKTTGVRTNRVARTTRQNTRMMAAKVGDKMTSFSLPSTKGGKTKVPAKNGSVVFFFNKSDTPGCKAEADTFDELSARSRRRVCRLLESRWRRSTP